MIAEEMGFSDTFLGIDAILNIYINVSHGLVVYPRINPYIESGKLKAYEGLKV